MNDVFHPIILDHPIITGFIIAALLIIFITILLLLWK